MAAYVDGFLIPLPKTNVERYRKMAKLAGKVWKEHGALAYIECVGDDLDVKGMLGYAKVAKARPGETVVFAFIVYKSRAHRERVNRRVMADPRMAKMPEPMPFDPKRMAYGGFKSIVHA